MKRIKSYILQTFLLKLLQVFLGFSLLIYLINFCEIIGSDSTLELSESLTLSLLAVPQVIDQLSSFLVFLSVLITVFILSIRSEMVVMKSSGISLWGVFSVIALAVFGFGVGWVLLFNPIAAKTGNHLEALKEKYFKDEASEILAPQNGIWLKQSNLQKEGEIVLLQASKVYRGKMAFLDMEAWFFDNEGKFYRRVDANKASLMEGAKTNFWLLENCLINDTDNLNQPAKTFLIPTDLSIDFVQKTVLIGVKKVESFSVYELPQLIKNLKSTGLQTAKFETYLQRLLARPLLFLGMGLIACYFGVVHARNRRAILSIVLGLIVALVLFIIEGILNLLASSSVIPNQISSWVIALIYCAIGVLLIYKKEHNKLIDM